MLVQLDGAIVHILTMLNDVAHFIVIKRELAHSDKKVGHPGTKVWWRLDNTLWVYLAHVLQF